MDDMSPTVTEEKAYAEFENEYNTLSVEMMEFSDGDNLEDKLVQKYIGNKNPARIRATVILTLAGVSIITPINKPKETAINPPAKTMLFETCIDSSSDLVRTKQVAVHSGLHTLR